MTARYTGSGSSGYDYVQGAQPDSPDVGEMWLDTSVMPAEAYIYSQNGNWVQETVTDHAELANVDAGQHFNPGNVLTFNSGVLDLVFGNGLTNSGGSLAVVEGDISHDNIAGVSSDDHHSRYTDSEARSAVDGSNVSVDHDNLTGVSASDHHSRYSDSEARSAVDGSSVSLDHANLTNVSTDDHHARYTDSEAQAATHSRYTDGEARNAVDGANVDIAGDADTVDGKDASELGFAWEEDPNSPWDFGSSTSHTISLANTYDTVRVYFAETGDGYAEHQLQDVNGAGCTWDYTQIGSQVNESSGMNYVPITSDTTANGRLWGVEMTGSSDSGITGRPMNTYKEGIFRFLSSDTSGPFSSITITLNYSRSAKARVMGFNM
jgi:hypothetical protein